MSIGKTTRIFHMLLYTFFYEEPGIILINQWQQQEQQTKDHLQE